MMSSVSDYEPLYGSDVDTSFVCVAQGPRYNHPKISEVPRRRKNPVMKGDKPSFFETRTDGEVWLVLPRSKHRGTTRVFQFKRNDGMYPLCDYYMFIFHLICCKSISNLIIK
jgi:hypothetical protein